MLTLPAMNPFCRRWPPPLFTAIRLTEKLHICGRATASAKETIRCVQEDTTAVTYYCDDFSLRRIDSIGQVIASRFLNSINPWVGATISGSTTGAGVVVSLDDPNKPHNFVMAYTLGDKKIALIKVVDGVETLVANPSFRSGSYIDGELLEVRKMDSNYQVYYGGKQVGTDYTINDASVINNQYVGLVSFDSSSSFGPFYARSSDADYPIPTWPNWYAGATYPKGNGVISIRFDDGRIQDYNLVYPLLAARGITAGFAIIRTGMTAGDVNFMTLAQVLELQAAGMEMMCHSLTHTADPPTLELFINETARACLEEQMIGLNISSFVQPGTWLGACDFTSPKQYGTPDEVVLRQYFKCYEAYLVPFDLDRLYKLPRTNRWGVNHLESEATLSELTGMIDDAINNHMGCEVMFHSESIGTTTGISVAHFTTFLDYIQTKVKAGTLTVLTPTQQLFATPE